MSVETSSSASSTATESPTFLSQRVTVPSETLSPKAGIVMTVPAPVEGTDAATTGAGVSTATTGGSTATTVVTGWAGTSATGAEEVSPDTAMIASSAPTGTV